MNPFQSLIALAALAVSTATPSEPPPQPPSRDFVVHCGQLYTGTGTVIDDCWLVIRDGKIAELMQGSAPAVDLPVVDAADKVVIPGLVAADTELSDQGDDAYAVTPDLVALDGFDFHRKWRQALSGGVTTAYLAPGRNRLVPGQGSVVKLWGDDMVARVLAENACLRLTLGPAANQTPAVFEPVVSPHADEPQRPARRQYPSARISQLATLRQLFASAQRAEPGELLGGGPAERRYDPSALALAARGELPLRIAAHEAADLRRALQLGAELGQRVVLEDPWQLEQIARQAQEQQASAVFRVPVKIGDHNPGGENRRDERPTSQPEAPAAAAKSGLRIALAPGSDQDLADFLMVAGVAIRHGLDADRALRAITSDAAAILGVEERVGSLSKGKDADFLVLSGEPFAVGTMVEQTWVDGHLAYEREAEGNLLAVRAGRVLTGDGRTLHQGMIVVADGKIRAIGEELTLPYGARVIDLGDDAVIVPGFIDSNSALGLSGDGTGIPGGSPDQDIARAVDPLDPAFQPALRAGITTVLSSGRDGGLLSGRVAALKTGAMDRESMIVDDLAAQRFVFDSTSPRAIGALKGQLDQAKKYIEAWNKYEQALADFEAGKTAKPEDAEPEAETEAPEQDPVSGNWECKLIGVPIEMRLLLELRLEGTRISGTATMEVRGNRAGQTEIEGFFKGGKLEFELTMLGQSVEVSATIADDKLEGTITGGPMDVRIEGQRTSRDAPAPAAAKGASDEDGKPKKPKRDQRLEALREVLEGDATAVIRSDKAPAIRAVVELFRAEKLRFALQDARDAVDSPELLGEDPPPVLLGPSLVERKRGKRINLAAKLVEAGVPIALATGDVEGVRYLPLHTAYAIRYGLDPEAALRALTIAPAEAFGIDDRVGSLARGKDADFVVFSGGPFEMTSRVLLVVCNGRVAHDGRSEEETR